MAPFRNWDATDRRRLDFGWNLQRNEQFARTPRTRRALGARRRPFNGLIDKVGLLNEIGEAQ
jgi:hypothetical protein